MFVSSGISLVFAVADCFGDFLFDFGLNLNSEEVQCLDAVVIEPRLGDIKIDDSFSEILEDKLHVVCVLLGE